MATNDTPQVDLAAIEAEINGMSQEDVQNELLKIRVRQKVQQKKHQGSEQQKKYQAKQREKAKLLKAAAIKLGIYDEINEKADKLADDKLAEDTPVEEDEPTAA